MNQCSISVAATGKSLALGAASVGDTIPVCSDATKPRYVRLATTTAAFIRWGNGAQTAVATDMLLMSGDSVIIKVAGSTHIAALQAATGGILIVTPLEDK